jgi:hypothetical protein
MLKHGLLNIFIYMGSFSHVLHFFVETFMTCSWLIFTCSYIIGISTFTDLTINGLITTMHVSTHLVEGKIQKQLYETFLLFLICVNFYA